MSKALAVARESDIASAGVAHFISHSLYARCEMLLPDEQGNLIRAGGGWRITVVTTPSSAGVAMTKASPPGSAPVLPGGAVSDFAGLHDRKVYGVVIGSRITAVSC